MPSPSKLATTVCQETLAWYRTMPSMWFCNRCGEDFELMDSCSCANLEDPGNILEYWGTFRGLLDDLLPYPQNVMVISTYLPIAVTNHGRLTNKVWSL